MGTTPASLLTALLLGLAYGVSTIRWPEPAKPSRLANWIGLVFLTLLVPWSNYVNGFENEKPTQLGQALGVEDTARFVTHQQTLGLVMLALVALDATRISFPPPRAIETGPPNVAPSKRIPSRRPPATSDMSEKCCVANLFACLGRCYDTV